MQKKIALLLFLFLLAHMMMAQVQPLSRMDSGRIFDYNAQHEKYLQAGNKKEASRYLNEIAFLYWNHNLYKEAVDYYERSLVLNESIDNENGAAMIYNNLGMLYADLERYDESLESFTKTLASRKANGESAGIISALINRSVVLNNLKKFDESIADLQEALSLARSENDMDQMKSVYGMLSETYEKNGQIDLSIQYFDLYRTFHEQIQRDRVDVVEKQLQQESVQKKLVEAEMMEKELELLKSQLELQQKNLELSEKDSINLSLYQDLSRREIELQLLERDAELKSEQAKVSKERNRALQEQQVLMYIIAGVVAASLLIILIIIYINFKKTSRLNKVLRETNELLKRQKVELAESNEIKNRLFTIIGHDLRSPLYSLKSLFIVFEDYQIEPELAKILNKVKIHLFNTITLVDNVLNWSSQQISNKSLSMEVVDIAPIITQNLDLISPLAETKNITVKSNIEDKLKAHADQGMIDVVVRNLVQNALKFTEKGGVIEVSALGRNGSVVISVKDNGIGMDNEKINYILKNKFNRPTQGTEGEHGSGLGLYLCADLIRKNNGTIEVDSQMGTGSTFTFTLNKP